MTRTLEAAIAIARVWTRLYTSGLDQSLRDARRAEIESDLWESHEDARRRGGAATEVALQILARLLLGMPHDLLWSIESRRPCDHRPRRLALIAGAALVSLAVLWVASILREGPLPVPPHSMVFVASPPPPPPPTPPPPLPSSMADNGRDGRRPATDPRR
ncbi:MAG TPA: hypothetical protein VHU82_02120 [Vicinamibacterales bacterium]|nr:hypothetical protein [Vicinamibacterales bacterium]